jgi:hypothetical protein
MPFDLDQPRALENSVFKRAVPDWLLERRSVAPLEMAATSCSQNPTFVLGSVDQEPVREGVAAKLTPAPLATISSDASPSTSGCVPDVLPSFPSDDPPAVSSSSATALPPRSNGDEFPASIAPIIENSKPRSSCSTSPLTGPQVSHFFFPFSYAKSKNVIAHSNH